MILKIIKMVKVEIYKTEVLKVHDTLEYEFEDLMQEFVADEEAGAGEEKQRTLVWAQGVVMWIAYIARPTSAIVDDEVSGTLHFQRVTYAMKEKFEKRLVRGNVTVNMLDQNEIPLYRDLANELKWYSIWKKGMRNVPASYPGNTYEVGDPVFVQSLEAIEKEIGIPNDEEYDYIKAGYKLELPAQITADILKKRRAIISENETKSADEVEPGTDEKLNS
jgi:hypothetical protein